MTDIALSQSIAGSLTATDLNIGGQFYDEYNLNIDSFRQLVINIAPSATAIEPTIAAIDSATDAIVINPSATAIEPTIALIDSATEAIVFENNTGQLTLMATTFPGINYKVRVSSTNLGDYTISAVDGGKATSIVTNSNDSDSPNSTPFGVGTVGSSGISGASTILQATTTPDPTDLTEPAVAIPDPTDPTAPAVAIPDPTDPTAPAVAIPDPTDPTAPAVAIPDPTDPTQPAVAIPIAYIDLNTNLFISSNTAIAGLKINAVSQKAGSKVNEIGAFVVDDATGKIGEIAPGTAGYLKAATDSAKTIFSSLNGSFFSTSARDVELDPNKTYQFFQVQDGSIADVQQQIASGKTPTNVLFSLPGSTGTSPFKITANGANDYKISINNNEIVLNGSLLIGINTPNIPIGAESQGLAQGRILDLTGSTGTLKADVTTKSDAAYTNTIAFYAVEDAILGTIKTTTGTILKPGDANYASEAIKSAVLSAGKTDSKLNQDLTGGKIYAPVFIAQGTLADFASKNPTNGGDADRVHAYFNYLGANPDKLDHFRLLGDNTFGVEDMYGGGDRDFNDVVISVNIKVA